VEDQQLGALIRAVRTRRGLRQRDLADAAGVARSTISEIETGSLGTFAVDTLRRIAGALDVRLEVKGWWRGGDGHRLLSRRHSLLSNAVAACVGAASGWVVFAEVSFSIWGERGVIDLLAWHAETGHLLVIELKTEFVDINEMLGTLDRKSRLSHPVAEGRGWQPTAMSVWLIVADSRTNRRHAAEHSALLSARFPLDGRSFGAFLRRPAEPTAGLAFWTDANRSDPRRDSLAPTKAVRLRKATSARADGSRVNATG
jgi:DNA-binding XRE family transcriptional regulator